MKYTKGFSTEPYLQNSLHISNAIFHFQINISLETIHFLKILQELFFILLPLDLLSPFSFFLYSFLFLSLFFFFHLLEPGLDYCL